jgi:hypothetical protein
MRTTLLALTTVLVVASAAGAALLLRTAAPTPPPASPVEGRGRLLDYSGTPLTSVAMRWQAFLDLRGVHALGPSLAAQFATELASQLRVDEERMRELALRGSGSERRIAGYMEDLAVERVSQWLDASQWRRNPRLVRFVRQPIRTYPESAWMAPVVGITNVDGDGIEGLELQLDKVLRDGADVRISVEIDKQRAITYRLAEAVHGYELDEVGAVAIELRSGRVAAMVSLPSYDPDDLPNRHGANMRLKPVTDVFQPGPLLQPFLLYGVLSADLPERDALSRKFVAGQEEAGIEMARVLGRGGIMLALKRSRLIEPMEVDFPGRANALVRRDATTDALLQEFGNGEAVAMSLLRYSTSLAGILTGYSPTPTTLADLVKRAPTESAAIEGTPAIWTDETDLAADMRGELIKRARISSGDLLADFGGAWAVYRERAKEGDGVRRGVLALFAPAADPRYLLVLNARSSNEELTADALLRIGTDTMSTISPTTAAPRPLSASR